jgi:hypothetical protein
MTTTTFVNTVTPVVAPWLNDVNNLVYGNAGNAVRSSTGNWTIPAPSAGIALSVTGLISTSAAIASRTDGNTLTVGLLTQNTTVGAGAGSYVLVSTDSTSAGALASYGTAHSSFPNATRLFTTSTGNLSIGVNQLDVITLNGTTRGVTIAAPASGVSTTIIGFSGSDTLVANGGTSGSFRVNTTGVPYGTSIHNNAGAVTGTTNQYITSGSYTPTSASPVNVTVGTVRQTSWTRVGNVVHVSGAVNFAVTAGGFWSFTLTLPFNPNLTQVYQLNGAITPTAATNFTQAKGSGANLALFSGNASAGVISGEYGFWFDFEVIS